MKKTIISLLCGLVIISIGGIIFWYSKQESIDTTIPDCDPVVDAPVIVINDIPKTCHTGETLWWTIPEELGGVAGTAAIYSGEIYENSDGELWTWLCRRGDSIFSKLDNSEVHDQNWYNLLINNYSKNNILSVYGRWLEYSLLGVWPSTYYETRDTYDELSDETLSTLYALGYQQWYKSLEDFEHDKSIFAFNDKLYDPFYTGVENYMHQKIYKDAEVQSKQQQTYSSPRKITWVKNEKLVFTRQTAITIVRDTNGNAIGLGSGDSQYKDKYGEEDDGGNSYIVSYNIETCTEN